MAHPDASAPRSPNFHFLTKVDPLLADLGLRAERYALEDPVTAIMKVRQLGELLAQSVAAKYGIDTTVDSRPKDQRTLLDELFRSRALPADINNLFHEIRKEGNQAIHAIKGDQGRAITVLRYARQAAVWFFRTHFDRAAKLGPFVPPLPKSDTSDELKREIARLEKEYENASAALERLKDQAADEQQLRQLAEDDRKRAFQDLDAAMSLVEEEFSATQARITELENRLAETSQTAKPTQSETQQMVETGQQVADEVLSEADTRELIDIQLREAGWIVDSKNLRYSKGTRPQKNKNTAIAEWPTSSGPADYVLFIGLAPVAIVEAKRKNIDVAGAIAQARRYSGDFVIQGTDIVSPGGPWGDCKVPFLFSTNGRGYLKQLKTKSGVWFLDSRRSTNLPRPLVSWYTPEGLGQLLSQDIDEAEQRLQVESTGYLPLRFYQEEAVKAVERAISDGEREMLLAMATGTGKTRTCIGICYRLIKAKRFRRILFLVDRTSLGEQTSDALHDLRIENNQTFADIYDVKELGDLTPDQDTKFHIATIQAMVKRVLGSDDTVSALPVDQYDCIVVDECHRGYSLDQELSDSELGFRDETDYISKYSRILEYFDAVKIGLTATPAVHTTEIFGGTSGMPIYQYSYRQAVLDGYLVDHEPPLQIKTRLAQDGIQFQVNEEVAVYDNQKQQLELFNTPDEIVLEIDSFNRKVVNENFNRVICRELAKHIDPSLPGKTLVFCVSDMHADMVVSELNAAFKEQYGEIENQAVLKITGKAHKPLQLIRRFKNERYPSVVVTVDLLTTGIDVPEICNLVFLRRVRSRILYDQMLGRGTRLCSSLHGLNDDKSCFHIFDCVELYSSLKSYTDMQAVVTNPNISFSQLLDELASVTTDEHRQTIKEQLIAKLQRKKRSLKGSRAQVLEEKSGKNPESLIEQIQKATPDEIVEWFADKTNVVEFLDQKAGGGGTRFFVSEHEDEVVSVESGFGKGNQRPKDYLEEFREFVTGHQNDIAAIKLCATRPRDLTRQTLKELQIELDKQGFSETRLRVAWRETKNVEIAATIIGYIRNAILQAPLEPFEDRVNKAMTALLTSRQWTQPQRKWLDRIGKQFKENTLVDRDAFNQGQFREHGGFDRLNKVFDGKLVELLGQITDEIWGLAA
ncbi:Type-1 restriction enzyme R protein [Roseimaritima multifibrata]|uniref:Type-1 restriction enzyme R protein n=1 Tax=Roseimaritima multifibrata TaxID=1930274 RepID=A0A517MAC0_9BACT|nr:type I restriction-modification system endonuclease [Roseimaritima multifibrata]QDS91824.1 Type-1 restriction enzyme R protein [Roseimaritima multifibrata]